MTLAQVWHDMKHITGWIRILEDSGVFTDSELRELERLDDENIQGWIRIRTRKSKTPSGNSEWSSSTK